MRKLTYYVACCADQAKSQRPERSEGAGAEGHPLVGKVMPLVGPKVILLAGKYSWGAPEHLP